MSMNAKDYDYLVRFPSDFQLSDLFAFVSSKGFQVRYVPTDATRRQPPRMYEAVPVEETAASRPMLAVDERYISQGPQEAVEITKLEEY